MEINCIELFDEEEFLQQDKYKIVSVSEIRRALASVLMSDDLDIARNTIKFVEWYNKSQFLFKERTSRTKKANKDFEEKL